MHVEVYRGVTGQVAGVGEQAVGDVDHRRRAGLRGLRARVVRRVRAPVGLDQGPGRAEAPAQHGQSTGRPALPAGQGEDVPDLGSGADDRSDGAHAQHGHRDHHLGGAGQVAADDAGAHPAALLDEPGRELQRPGGGQVGRCGQADRQRRGPTPHRVDVGDVLRRRPVTHVGSRGPVAPEVSALDQEVGGDEDVPGPDPQHGGVVAGPQQDVLALGEQPGQCGDQAELPGVGQGRPRGRPGVRPGVDTGRRGRAHDPIPPDVHGRVTACRARPVAR